MADTPRSCLYLALAPISVDSGCGNELEASGVISPGHLIGEEARGFWIAKKGVPAILDGGLEDGAYVLERGLARDFRVGCGGRKKQDRKKSHGPWQRRWWKKQRSR